MSVSNQVPFNTHTANGVSTSFSFGFLLLDPADLIVEVAGVQKTLGPDYAISGLGNPVGGSVDFTTAPASGKVLIKRILTLQRLTDYQDNGDLLADTLNNDLDRIWQALQQLQQNDTRALKLPFDTTVDQALVESSAARAGLIVGFDASGNMTLKAAADLSLQTVSGFIATLLDDPDAAAARATLGVPPSNTNGANLDANSIPLSRLVRGTAAKVLLGMGAGADPIWGDAPFSVSSIPAKGITRAMLADSVIQKVKKLPKKQQADIGYAQFMVQMEDDSLLAWGRTYTMQIGVNHQDDTYILPRKPSFNVAIPDGVTVKEFTHSNGSAYVLFSNGWVFSSGQNQSGQLGLGDTTSRSTFTRIEYFVTNSIVIDKIFAIGSRNAVNYQGAFFLNAAGNVWACGYNAAGQLGVGDTTNRLTPTAISGAISGVVSISGSCSNQSSNFLITSGGALYACGYNGQGQLGLGDTTNRSAFTLVTGITGVAEVSATSCDNPGIASHTVARLTNGDVYACGFNTYGQLGLGDTTNRSGFTKLSTLANIVSIGTCGGYYGISWAVSNAGRLYTWGYNANGAIGDGSTVNRTSPFDVVGWSGNTLVDPPFVGKIAKVEGYSGNTSYGSLIVLDTDGNLWFAGHDYVMYCGDAAEQRNRFTPFTRFRLDSSGEKITDITSHGTDATYRIFCLSDHGKLYAQGDNTSGVCNGGFNAAIPAVVRCMQKVPLN
jgi:alpha-tubulin suppressor-like RCC1 family protein